MSGREQIYQLLDALPDNKIAYVIGYLQGLMAEEVSEPNAEKIAAMRELENGGGEIFNGSTEDFFNKLQRE